MKRIKSYTLGWDTDNKAGYISLVDEFDEKHLFSKISQQELSMYLLMLRENQIYLDNQNWLIVGWKENGEH